MRHRHGMHSNAIVYYGLRIVKLMIMIFIYLSLTGCLGMMFNTMCKISNTVSPPGKTSLDYIKLGNQAEYLNDYENAAKSYSVATESHPSVTSYSSLARTYQNQGEYRDAILMKRKQAEMENSPSSPGQCYQELGTMYIEHGMYDDAKKYYDDAITAMRLFDKAFPAPFSHEEGTRNVCYGKYYLWTGDYETSIYYQVKLLTDMRTRRPPAHGFDIANQENVLALDLYFSGKIDEAEKISEHAARASGMFTEYYVPAITMLGRIAECRNDYNGAMARYKSGLNALEKITRPNDYDPKVDKANLWRHVGRGYYKTGKNEEACAAFTETKRLRIASATQGHPDYADAIRDMAELSVTAAELTSATLQAEESLKILDNALVPTHPRIAPTLIALSSIYELTGKSDQAASLNTRIEAILQKPLGPWKEDFMETVAFYAEQLKKANNPAAAQYLEQLQSRQKDKR